MAEPVDATQEEKKAPEAPQAPKAPRIQSKKLALTYSQCNVTGEQFKEAFKSLLAVRQHGIFALKMVQEPHAGDLGHHYHVALKLIKKPNIRDMRAFDIVVDGKVFHPNIKNMRSDWWANVYMGIAQVLWEHQEGADTVNLDMVEYGRKRKVYDDMCWWREHVLRSKLQMAKWPLVVPYRAVDGSDRTIICPKPDAANKKRHYWVYGPPDVGKTHQLEAAVKDFRVLFPGHVKYPYEDYDGQEIVIFDDIFPCVRDLLNGCNATQCVGKPVGETRYRSVYWQANQARVVFVLLNVDIDTHFSKADPLTKAAVHARFQEISLH